MRERWKRLVKSVYKKEGRLNEFERGYEKMTKHKLTILSNFGSKKLEELLEKSTKNVAQEVVSILISVTSSASNAKVGLLSAMENSGKGIKKPSQV